jgi:hypothetical protein
LSAAKLFPLRGGGRYLIFAAIAWALLLPASAPAEPPANDDFAAATPLFDRGRNDNALGTTEEATRELDEPAHGGYASGASVWFRWTAWLSGTARIYPCGGSFHPVISVYAGDALTGLSPVGSPSDIGPTGEYCTLGGRGGVVLEAVAGQTYSIAVDGPAGQTGWFELIALDAPFPPLSATPRIGSRIAIRKRSAKIRFDANMATASFLCKLDRRPATPCTSPVAYKGLRPGRHRIAVTAIGEPGAPVLPPAVRHFRIHERRGR